MIVLSNNENPDQNPALSHLKITDTAHRYTPNSTAELTEKIASYAGVKKDEVLLAAGSSDLIEQIARLLVKPDENIIYSNHSFIWYRMITSIIRVKANVVEQNNYHHDLASIKMAINSKTRVIFIDNPNNPFGTVLSYSELKNFIDFVPESVYIVIDEAYYEYVNTKGYQSCIPLINQHKKPNCNSYFFKSICFGRA